jgi:DNA-directed RNA polymerase subunit H
MAEEIDILGHELVPKHEVLSKEEAEEVLKRYRAKPRQFPLILVSDPASKAVGARAGDIIKITRKSPTAGETIAYRYVVEE